RRSRGRSPWAAAPAASRTTRGTQARRWRMFLSDRETRTAGARTARTGSPPSLHRRRRIQARGWGSALEDRQVLLGQLQQHAGDGGGELVTGPDAVDPAAVGRLHGEQVLGQGGVVALEALAADLEEGLAGVVVAVPEVEVVVRVVGDARVFAQQEIERDVDLLGIVDAGRVQRRDRRRVDGVLVVLL